MSLFKLRPLALGCFAFLVCLCASYFLGNIFNIIIIALGAVTVGIFIALILTLKRDKIQKIFIKILPLCLCIVICGATSMLVFSRDKKIEQTYADTEQEMELVITEIVYSESYETVAKARDDKFKLLVSVNNNKISVGDKIKAIFKLRSLDDSEYGFSERDAYADERIFLCAEAEGYEIISKDNFVFGGVLRKINSFLVKIVKDSVNSDTASLVSAMLLGNRDDLPDTVSRDFSRLGISHILALSGIHLSLVTAMASAFLGTIQMPKRPKHLLLIAIIVTFICITGFSSSAIRAGAMLIFYYTMLLLGDTSDGASALFLSVALICLFDPYSIFSLSLLLSFVAMLGCILASSLTRHERRLYRIRPKFIRGIVYSLIGSVTVMLLTLPIVFLKFGRVSIFSPIFNIIFVPILTLLLYLSPFILILGKIPYVSYIVKYPAELITKLVLSLIKVISKADFLTIPFSNKIQLIGVGIILVGMLLAIILSKKRVKISILTVALGVAIFAGTSAYVSIIRQNQVTVSDLSSSDGDILGVESKNELMIISSTTHTSATVRGASFLATSLGYSDIDTYVITDYSHRLEGSIDTLTSRNMVRKILIPTPKTDKEREYYKAVKKICENREVALLEIGEKIEFEATCVDFMEYQRLARSTKRCVAFSISAYNARLTYLGASSYECDSSFPKNYVKISDILLFGSYGPNYKINYSYNTEHLDYLVFHGQGRDFWLGNVDESKIVEPNHKFIFKVSRKSD
ncbi:MAG: ComEC/Rec2 family competence protein [Ruminococcaceae bacterium]|nr:ComEC/Rec2 family competence protein [Oscillospiraceae bacterium]